MAHAITFHIGVPKSGSTFLQEVLWRSADRLSDLDVSLAGDAYPQHMRAMLDLCRRPGGPRVPGAWDRLARRIHNSSNRVIISQEGMSGATAPQIARARQSLEGMDLTVVLTVRDPARQLASYWQQRVKTRYAGTLAEMSAIIRAHDPAEQAFWLHQDVLAITDRWLAAVPRERFVVVTLPPIGSDPAILWNRFAQACELDAAGFDLEVERPNESLGGVQVELLRRLNAGLGDRLPLHEGYALVRRLVAHEVLPRIFDERPLVVEESTFQWAHDLGVQWQDGLENRRVSVVGDLSDLRPTRPIASPAGDTMDDSELLTTALEVISDLLVRWHAEDIAAPKAFAGVAGAYRRVGGGPTSDGEVHLPEI